MRGGDDLQEGKKCSATFLQRNVFPRIIRCDRSEVTAVAGFQRMLIANRGLSRNSPRTGPDGEPKKPAPPSAQQLLIELGRELRFAARNLRNHYIPNFSCASVTAELRAVPKKGGSNTTVPE
jgi:hypothetical protein